MATLNLTCFACRKPTEFVDSVGFRDECEFCGADAHVCKNCRFYDVTAYNECRESSADRVVEKERANYCDFFQPGDSSAATSQSSKEDLLNAAESLFKKQD